MSLSNPSQGSGKPGDEETKRVYRALGMEDMKETRLSGHSRTDVLTNVYRLWQHEQHLYRSKAREGSSVEKGHGHNSHP